MSVDKDIERLGEYVVQLGGKIAELEEERDTVSWTIESERSIFEICSGSTVLILLKSEEDGVTIDNGQTVDISFMRSNTQIITTSDRYYSSDILAWASINGLTETKAIKESK